MIEFAEGVASVGIIALAIRLLQCRPERLPPGVLSRFLAECMTVSTASGVPSAARGFTEETSRRGVNATSTGSLTGTGNAIVGSPESSRRAKPSPG